MKNNSFFRKILRKYFQLFMMKIYRNKKYITKGNICKIKTKTLVKSGSVKADKSNRTIVGIKGEIKHENRPDKYRNTEKIRDAVKIREHITAAAMPATVSEKRAESSEKKSVSCQLPGNAPVKKKFLKEKNGRAAGKQNFVSVFLKLFTSCKSEAETLKMSSILQKVSERYFKKNKVFFTEKTEPKQEKILPFICNNKLKLLPAAENKELKERCKKQKLSGKQHNFEKIKKSKGKQKYSGKVLKNISKSNFGAAGASSLISKKKIELPGKKHLFPEFMVKYFDKEKFFNLLKSDKVRNQDSVTESHPDLFYSFSGIRERKNKDMGEKIIFSSDKKRKVKIWKNGKKNFYNRKFFAENFSGSEKSSPLIAKSIRNKLNKKIILPGCKNIFSRNTIGYSKNFMTGRVPKLFEIIRKMDDTGAGNKKGTTISDERIFSMIREYMEENIPSESV